MGCLAFLSLGNQLSYQVLARKWRSKNFSELVGQEHITTTLLNALKSARLAHALLFTGPRGTGKTSTARILAKSLRCPNAKNFISCGECDICQEIFRGASIDVIEIDGASNNGVDAIRELRETVHFMPSSGKWKVYIIDEVHMLTTSAFNALLKTLEEPPEHVVFILATTEVQKIPPTILSRCQRFDFRRIPLKQMADHLQKICEAEGIKIDSTALWMIVRQSEGCMRDAQSLLDQVANFCDKNVTTEKVVEVLGLTDRRLLMETVEALVSREHRLLVSIVERIFASGYDAKAFAQDLLEEIRHLLFVKMSSSGLDLAESEVEFLRGLAGKVSNEDIHLLFDMTFKGVSDLLRAQDPKLVLEMLLLRMAEAPRVQNLQTILANLASGVPTVSGASTASTAVAKERVPNSTRSAQSAAQAVPSAKPTTATATVKAPVAAPAKTDSKVMNEANWNLFVQKLNGLNALMGAKLANTHFISLQGSKVVVGLDSAHGFLHGQISDADFVKKVNNYLVTLMHMNCSVEFIVDGATASLSLNAIEEKQKKESTENTQRLIEQNPLVQSVKTHFKAKIESIKDMET